MPTKGLLKAEASSHFPPSTHHHHHLPLPPPTPSLWERVPWRPWDISATFPATRFQLKAICHGWRRSQGSASACRRKTAHEPGCSRQASASQRSAFALSLDSPRGCCRRISHPGVSQLRVGDLHTGRLGNTLRSDLLTPLARPLWCSGKRSPVHRQ